MLYSIGAFPDILKSDYCRKRDLREYYSFDKKVEFVITQIPSLVLIVS